MDTFAALVPFAIAGSILPTWTLVVIALLGTARPVANAVAFIAGNAAFRGVLGLVILLVVPLPQSDSFRLDSGAWDARLVIAFGLGLLVLATWIWRRSGDENAGEWVERAERLRPRTTFVAGVIAVASPGVQYAYLLGGIAAIIENSRGVESIGALIIFVLALQWMLLLPVAVFLVFREGSERMLRRMKAFLSRRGSQLVASVLALAGAYVIALGVSQIAG